MKLSQKKWLSLLIFAMPLQMPAYAQWLPFDWAALPGFPDKRGAILLPVELDGLRCQMQLDTGSPNSVLYRNALPAKLGAAAENGRLSVARVSIGAEHSPRNFELLYAVSPGGQPSGCDGVVGTVGDDFLLGARLTLDLRRARFRLERAVTGTDLYDDQADAHVIAMELHPFVGQGNVMPVISAFLGPGEPVKLLLDTGSAPVAINVFLERNWLSLVGLKQITDVDALAVPRWGGWISCYNAPTRQIFSFGDFVLPVGTSATFCVDPRAEPPSEQNRLYGLIGLAAFHNHRITLDYAAGKFIIAPSNAAP